MQLHKCICYRLFKVSLNKQIDGITYFLESIPCRLDLKVECEFGNPADMTRPSVIFEFVSSEFVVIVLWFYQLMSWLWQWSTALLLQQGPGFEAWVTVFVCVSSWCPDVLFRVCRLWIYYDLSWMNEWMDR